MHRTTLLVATALVAAACDKSEPAKPQEAKTAAQVQAQPASAPAEAPPVNPEDAAFQSKLASRVLAASGLGIGGKLSAFDIINGESGQQYCQVCKFGGSPKIMAVGTADDEAFKNDLKNLDAIAQKYGEEKIKAFAVITPIEGGKAITPKDIKAAQEQADKLKKELALEMPVVVPAPDEAGTPNKIWDQYYNITKSRTVMFADGKNEVKYQSVGTDDWSQLNEAIAQTLKS